MSLNKSSAGTLKILLAGVVWSASGLLSKWMPWGAISLVGARALVAVIALGLYRRSFKVRARGFTWLGALGVAGTSTLFMAANKLTSAANAIVLQYAMPVFVIAGCAVFLKQRPSKLELATCAVMLAGICMCFVEGLGGGSITGDIIALLSAVTYAAVFFAARLPGCDPFEYTYLGNLISCGCLLYIPFDPAFTLQPAHIVVALIMGLCLTGGYMLFSSGMRDGVSSVTAALIANVEPVLNPTWVYLAMGEFPGMWSVAGAAIVLTAATGYALMGRRRGEG